MYGYPHGTQVHLDWYSTASESFARLRSARPCLRTCRWIRAPTPMSAAPSKSGTPSATSAGPPAWLQPAWISMAQGIIITLVPSNSPRTTLTCNSSWSLWDVRGQFHRDRKPEPTPRFSVAKLWEQVLWHAASWSACRMRALSASAGAWAAVSPCNHSRIMVKPSPTDTQISQM